MRLRKTVKFSKKNKSIKLIGGNKLVGFFVSLFKIAKVPFQKISKFLNSFKIYKSLKLFYLERLSILHLRIRLVHDITYKRGGWYKKYSDSPASTGIHKATIFAFVFSFIVFQVFQNLYPYLLTLKPQEVQAGTNSKVWSSYNDFNTNTAKSNIKVNGTGADLAGNVQIRTTADFGDGSDGAISTSQSIPGATYESVLSEAVNPGSQTIKIASAAMASAINTQISDPNKTVKLLLYNVANPSSEFGNLAAFGRQEEVRVVAVNLATNELTLESGLQTPAVSGQSYAFPVTTTKVIKIMQYTTVTAGTGVTISRSGTLLAFKVNGTLTMSGGAITTGAGLGLIKASSIAISSGNITASGSGYGQSAGSIGLVIGGAISIPSTTAIQAVGSPGRYGYSGEWNGGCGCMQGGYPDSPPGNGGNIYIKATSFTGSNPTVVAGTGGPYTASAGTYTPTSYVVYNSLGSLGTTGAEGTTQANDVGLRYDAGGVGMTVKPTSISWNANTDSLSQKVYFTVRAGDDQTGLNNSACYGPSGSVASPCTNWWQNSAASFSQINGAEAPTNPASLTNITPKRYVEVLVRMEGSGSNTPTVNEIKLYYDHLQAPTGGQGNDQMSQTKSDDSAMSNSGGVSWTNDSKNKLKVVGYPGIANGGSNTYRAYFEVVEFSGTFSSGADEALKAGTTSTGSVIYQGDLVNVGQNSFYEFTGNLGAKYKWRAKVEDDAGRVSAYSTENSDNVFQIEQTAPTVGSFSVKDASTASTTYVGTSKLITATGVFNDAGGSSGTLQVQFSEDVTNWGVYSGSGMTNNKTTDWTNYTTVTASATPQDISNAWALEGDDGPKDVFVRVKDNAGNVGIYSSSVVETTDANFTAGTQDNTYVTGNSVKWKKPDGATASSASECSTGILSGSICGPWYPGAGVLTGKFVYNSTTLVNAAWKTSLTLGGPLNTPEYPAQFSCYNIGGRLPTLTELQDMRGAYGIPAGVYWSSTELDASNAWVVVSPTGQQWGETKTGSAGVNVRCVADTVTPGSLRSDGIFTSQPVDLTASKQLANIYWGETSASGTSITMQFRAGEDNTPDNTGDGGNWSAWTPVSNSADITSFGSKRYVQYKATLNGQTVSPYGVPSLDDVTVLYVTPDAITLDTQAPAAFSLTGPANNTWQQSATPTLSWIGSSDGNGIARYELFIDGVNTSPGRSSIDPLPEGNTTTPAADLSQGNHTWRIKAVDNAGNETFSTETWNIGFDNILPSLVLDPGFTFTASDTNSTNVVLNWGTYADDSGTGAPTDHYTIERMKNVDYELDEQTLTSDWSTSASYYSIGDKTGTNHTDTVGEGAGNIEASVKYIYRIKVIDDAGNTSLFLISNTGLTADLVKPTNPSDVTASACQVNGTNCGGGDGAKAGKEVKISWTASVDTGTGVTGYKIYRRAETNSTVSGDFTVVGYLDIETPGAPVSTIWYDNDTNNDATFTDTINDTPNTIIKSVASNRLNDYVDYYYRVVAIDATGNQTDIITLDNTPPYSVNNTNFAATKTVDVTKPSVPADLTATAMGIDDLDNDPATQAVNITWSASTDTRIAGRTPTGNGSGVKEYQLYRAVGNISGPTAGFVLINTTAGTSYTEKGLDEFSYYYYKVKAIDSTDNTGDLSGQSQTRTLSSQVPSTPSSVNVVSLKGDPNTNSNVGKQITITFTGSKIKYNTNRIDGYQVYRSTTNHASATDWTDPVKATLVKTFSNLNIAGDTQDGSRNFTDEVPSNATTYYYKVRAVGNNPDLGGVANSGLSTVSAGTLNAGWDTTPDSTKPSAPLEVKVKDIHGDGSSMLRNIITWVRINSDDSQNKRLGSTDFKEYRVYRYTDTVLKSDLSLRATKTNLGDNYFVDELSSDPAVSNKDYYYYVVAVDNAATEFKYANGTVINGTSNTSSNLSPVSINPAAAKPTVSGVNVTGKGVSSATINWITNQTTDALVEYRKKDKPEDVIAVGKNRTTPSMNHAVELKALEKGVPYEYRIVSRNSLGNIDETAASEWKEFETEKFSIENIGVATTTTTATVSWTTPIDSDSNVEYQKQTGLGAAEKSETAGEPSLSKDHSVVIKGLKPDTNYTYKIRSVTSDKYIAETQFLTLKTQPYDASQFVIAPNASSVAEQNITATSAKITWNTAVATTSWLDYGTTSGNYSQSAGNDGFSTVHVVELLNLTPGTTYYYKVRGKDSNDVEYTSKEYSFTAVLKPEITNIKVANITPYGATVTFDTNVDTTVFVATGKTTSYNGGVGKNEFARNHSILLDNLEDASTYHYQIAVKDKLGNEAKSADESFTTPLDTTGPSVKEVKIDLLPMGTDDETAAAIISWTTDKPATTQIEYDEGVVGNSYSQFTIPDTSLNRAHTVIVKDLTPGTTYRFRVIAKDKKENLTKSQAYNFVTPTKEKSILQLIIRSLEETFSWVKDVGAKLNQTRDKVFGK